jgi:nitrite reductase (NADH) small subunit
LHDGHEPKHEVPSFVRVTRPRDPVEWQPVCRLSELEIERGAAALVHGQAIAVFRVDETTVYALANHDPFDRHATLARGIVGRDGELPFVASPVHKRAFDLRTGHCLDDAHVSVTAYDVRVADGMVLVGHRKTAVH